MSSYDDINTSGSVEYEHMEEFKLKIGFVLSPLFFAIVVDLIIEKARRVVLKNYCMQMTLFS